MTTDQEVFGRTLCEILNRTHRVRKYLDDVGPGESRQFVQIMRTMNSVLDQVEANALAAAPLATRELLDADDRAILFRALRVLSGAFSIVHEFLAYLPTLSIKPELVRTLETTFGSAYAIHAPSILLTSAFNAFEFDFVQQMVSSVRDLHEIKLSGDRNVVLQLPTADVASPVAWAVLGHELGHAIDASAEISGRVTAAVIASGTTLSEHIVKTMTEELAADLIAAHVLGPAPMASLLSMSYCLLPQEKPEWDLSRRRVYPPTRWRARVVLNYLTEQEQTFIKSDVDEYERAWRWRVGINFRDDAENIINGENKLLSPVISAIENSLIPEMANLSIQRASFSGVSLDRLQQRLAANLPVAAQGETRAELTRAISTYLSSAIEVARVTTRKDYDELRRRFDETPTPIAAILLSGCLRRKSLIEMATETLSSLSPEAARALSMQLEAADDRLRTSVESSAVHVRILNKLRPPALQPQKLATPIPSAALTACEEGALLSDIQILARLVEEDPEKNLFVSPIISACTQLGPASLDVRLGTDVQITSVSSQTHVDLERPRHEIAEQKRQYLRRIRIGPDGSFVLHPGEFMLASTIEYFRFPRDIAGRLEGRSSLARLGLQVHATAGFVDPGFHGNLTFELINSGSLPIRVAPGFRLGQLCFFPVRCVQVPYEGKYAGSISAESSRIEDDWEIPEV